MDVSINNVYNSTTKRNVSDYESNEDVYLDESIHYYNNILNS